MTNRIGRLQLLGWWVASIIGSGIVLAIVLAVTNTTMQPERTRYPLSQALVLIAASLVMLKAIVSRLHDIGWSGWIALLVFVPLVNLLMILALVVIPGQKGPNTFGEPPIFFRRFRRIRADYPT